MDTDRSSVELALAELHGVAPEAPFLALGQTVFWDEPMKAGLALLSRRLGYTRKLFAGVHDTDYFAKLPGSPHQAGRFATLPHNDTSTRGLWSAAGEFSTLFGSETVVTREMLQSAGLRLAALEKARPNILDQATEAWGWKGIISLDHHSPVTADVPFRQVMPEICATLDWALDTSLDAIGGGAKEIARALADQLKLAVCEQSDNQSISVAEFYRQLLPDVYEFCAGVPVDIETTRTTELLRFNGETCALPRFQILDYFVNPLSREASRSAYDEAIRHGSGLYELARFGTGAIPFDLVIPHKGRGTIRLGTKGAVIMTDPPHFLTFPKPLESIRDLAAAVEAKFGKDCVVVGKAVTLIGMLAQEFVFVFHEGASSYVKYSRKLHKSMAEAGHHLMVNPILRIRYAAWDSLQACCSWLRLPQPFQRAFGTEELCGPSFSSRWKEVASEQRTLIEKLGSLRRPIDLIRYLDSTVGGSWNKLAEEYEQLHSKLGDLNRSLEEIRRVRFILYEARRALAQERVAAERAKGVQFRAKVFELTPTPENIEERQRLTAVVDGILGRRRELSLDFASLRKKQNDLVQDAEIRRIHERRRSIELEAELKRLRLIREAVISSEGLDRSNKRPSAWWLRLVCPDGLWFRQTVDEAEYYLEPLI